jgi:hypothetical protein
LLNQAAPLTITEDENPFAKHDQYNNNEITKKLDFSRLSNPTVTLFRPTQGPHCQDENSNTLNHAIKEKRQVTYNAPLTSVQYQQTFDVKPSANVINIFAGNIDDYLKHIQQL